MAKVFKYLRSTSRRSPNVEAEESNQLATSIRHSRITTATTATTTIKTEKTFLAQHKICQNADDSFSTHASTTNYMGSYVAATPTPTPTTTTTTSTFACTSPLPLPPAAAAAAAPLPKPASPSPSPLPSTSTSPSPSASPSASPMPSAMSKTSATATTTATTTTNVQIMPLENQQLTTAYAFVVQHLRFVALHIVTSFCYASVNASACCNAAIRAALNTPPPHMRNVKGLPADDAATVEAVRNVTLAFKRKSLKSLTLHRLLLQLSGGYCGISNLDTRSVFYLLLFVFCYWSVLMHASAVAATTVPVSIPTPNVLTAAPERQPEPPTTITNLMKSPTDVTLIAISAGATVAYNTSILNRALRSPHNNNTRNKLIVKRDVANVPEEDYDTSYPEDIDDIEALINNKSAKGKYIGAPCNELKCDSNLLHVTCDKETLTCGCDKNYPVQLGPIKGCAKPKKLGDQCFYDETCIYNDENSLCVQVRHNALCQCANGFHSVSYTKPTRRVFCTQDLSELSSDLPTLLGVSTGIAVLAGLICMVLHLFSKTKYPRHRNFADANLPPPIMYSSDTGIPLTVHSGRPSSRSSIRSTGSIGSYGNRRASAGGLHGGGGGGIGVGAAGCSSGSKGILVSTSRTGSRRPSLASVHSTSSSVRSYSMMRFEKEAQQKEIRQEMKLRLARLQQQQHLNQNKPQIIIGEALIQHGALSRIITATPSPLTPNSLDELLPSVDETQEYPLKLEPANKAAAALSAIRNVAATSTAATLSPANLATASSASGATQLATLEMDISNAAAYVGPCSNSTEAI